MGAGWLLVTGLVGVILVVWLAGFAITTDLAVPPGDPRAFNNVLVIFPHADDETVNCGGAIRRLASSGAKVTLLILTAGERGNRTGALDPALKAVRKLEARRAARILGVATVTQRDLGDGHLMTNRDAAAGCIEETIRVVKPDLIVTYDATGLDGHPDHVACAEVVIEAARAHAPAPTLWCVALPPRLVRVMRLARQLPDVAGQRALPTARVFIGTAVVAKIRAWYAYRSQRGALGKGFGRLVPIWFAFSAMQFEYFARIG